MESKEKKKRLLTIIGVFILLVSIVGFTFAYFNSTVSSTGANIAGTTNADFASNLNITVTRINKTPTSASSINLVPSNITSDTTSITRAISHNCEADGYTGCHLYQITATTNSAISHANIYLDSLTVSGAAQDKSSWKYAVFTGTTTSATNIVTSGSFEVTTPGTIDIHNNSALASTVTYYLLIYITNDTANSQNSSDIHDVTGVYNGTVSMSAAGGKVSALFKSNENSNGSQLQLTPGIYTVSSTYLDIGQTIPGEVYTYNSINAAVTSDDPNISGNTAWKDILSNYNIPPVALKHVLDSNDNTIIQSYIEFVISNEIHNLFNDITAGTYELRGGVYEAEFSPADQTIYNRNKQILNNAFSESNCDENDYNAPELQYGCGIPYNESYFLDIVISNTGQIMVGINGDMPHCGIDPAHDDDPAASYCYG